MEESALWAIKSNNDSIDDFKVFDINKKIINLYLVISKKLDNSKEQIERFNTGLNKIKSTGQYEEIKQDYFSK
ncbi:hypothetical protein M9194_17690 [Vibrio sp. S4M6]|uniref:hypothetical protein n=1 Tax=Vibrio sinus TaxID=2946865 RepID=UPI002029E9B4|nr:hypothetical protein [Vibrio sinus]MCL9783265.1 hypothetical protein [Vibrio sinus]